MGRRKVDPDKRVRAVQACWQCKRSKKRCDASLPCLHCRKRGAAASCSFDDPRAPTAARKQSRTQPSTAISTDSGLHVTTGQSDDVPHVDVHTLPTPSTRNGDAQTLVDHELGGVTDEVESPGEARHRTRPRFLSNSHGNKVFIGASASLSFLQLVRDAVTQSIGDSDFSGSARKNQMLEAQGVRDVPLVPPELSDVYRLRYTNQFSAATRGIVVILTKEDARDLVNMPLEDLGNQDSSNFTLMCLVVAIGAQSCPPDEVNLNNERIYFSLGQKSAFTTMLENPSLEMIRIFLLMTFYMLGACQRNAAFMYLGVAARAAYILGLHKPDCFSMLSDEEREPRLMTWKSLVNLDLIISSILGREPATSMSLNDEKVTASFESAGELNDEALDASHRLSLLVNGIGSRLYGAKVVTSQDADDYLQRLWQWSKDLPASLRLSGVPPSPDDSASAQIIGSLHVSCYYHFAVMLVCRPFLISHLTKQLVNQSGRSRASVKSVSTSDGNSEMAELARTCLTAATYMAQTCAEVYEAKFILDSMCIIKAWIFAAGLVLGFHMFATVELDLEVEQAFNQARDVLQRLSPRSQQAAHYHDILAHLANAVIKQRQLVMTQRRGKSSQAVDKIFTLHPTTRSLDTVDNTGGVGDDDVDTMNAGGVVFNSNETNITFDESLFGWNNMGFQSWDQFNFDVGAMTFDTDVQYPF